MRGRRGGGGGGGVRLRVRDEGEEGGGWRFGRSKEREWCREV